MQENQHNCFYLFKKICGSWIFQMNCFYFEKKLYTKKKLYTIMGFLFSQFCPIDIFIIESCYWYQKTPVTRWLWNAKDCLNLVFSMEKLRFKNLKWHLFMFFLEYRLFSSKMASNTSSEFFFWICQEFIPQTADRHLNHVKVRLFLLPFLLRVFWKESCQFFAILNQSLCKMNLSIWYIDILMPKDLFWIQME